MAGFSINLEEKTLSNENFREVLFTTPRSQLVVMTLQAGEEIGAEKHDDTDQFIRVEAGQGKAILDGEEHALEDGVGVVILDGEEHALEDGVGVVIPAGTHHNVINTGSEPLKLYTLYTPPEHPDGTIHKDKAEADAYEAEHGHH